MTSPPPTGYAAWVTRERIGVYHLCRGLTHCCICEDCARFEREPNWCVRCGKHQLWIGWNNVCNTCFFEMEAEFGDGR